MIGGTDSARSGRRQVLALMALMLVLGWAAVHAAPARAVFPGATGGLIVSSKFYDPPDTTPALIFSMHDARFSPDASQVAGVMGSGSSASIWVANADGSNARQLTTPAPGGEGDSGPTWSPDGAEIAYVRTPPVSCGNGQSGCVATQLEDVNVATGVTRDITTAVYLTSYMTPDWSPDPGSHELVDVVSPNDGPNEIDLINTDTGARTTLAPSAGTPGYISVRFAPDGKSVVAGRGLPEDPPPSEIQVIPLPGLGGPSMTFPLLGSSVSLTHPTFTPDGAWVSFYDCRPGCGIWSASVPTPTDPPGTPPTFREDLAGSFFSLTLDWAPLIDEPVITAGPSGRVGSSAAAFEFSIPSADPGKYQCRIDQGAWEDDCTSPKEYTHLTDGQHTFDVRFYGANEDPNAAPVASRTWTSDTTPPEALIDQAPSGRTDSTDATVVFHSTEPDGATFECSQDGGPEYDCSSPQELSALGDGTHTFTVRAIDDVGNEQQTPTRVSWQVTEASTGGAAGGGSGGDGSGGAAGGITPPETPTSDCSNGRFTTLAVGSVVAEGRGTTCFVRTRKPDGSVVWTAAGPISLNGVQLMPSGVIRFDQKLSNLVMQMPAGTTLGFGSFTWTVPSSISFDLTTHFVMPNPNGEFEIAGLTVAAQPDFSLSTADGGSATVTLNLELPEIFQGAAGDESEEPQGAKGLTFAFKFIASNQKGVRFAFKGSLSSAWLFGKVQLSKLAVGLDTGPPLTFDGSATLSFPGVDGKFTITVGLSSDGAQSFHHVTKLALEASDLQKPIAYGVFLQRLGGRITSCVGADKQVGGEVTANAGLSMGPKIDEPPIFVGEPFSLDGTVTLSLCAPQSVKITGAGKIVEVPIGDVSAKYVWSQGRVDLTGNMDYTIGGWGFLAKVTSAFLDMPHDSWNVAASGQLRLPSLTGGVLNGQGDVVLSSNGLAACFGSPGERFGIAKHWGQDLQPFSDSCDVGPYSATAAVADAAAADSFSVRQHERLKVLAVRGSGAPPKIALIGPGGERIDTPDDATPSRTSRALVVQDPVSDTTYAVLFSPKPGRWAVTPEPGAPPPVSIHSADALPPISVKAGVSGSGSHPELTWSLHPQPGQGVQFVQQGAAGDQLIVTTTRARGHVGFTPSVAGGRARTIVAFVTENGLPRSQVVVAHFKAPAQPRLHAVNKLRLIGSTLRWSAQAAAADYSLMLRASSGATFATVTRHPSVPVPGPMRRRNLTVTISALSAGGNPGPMRTLTVRFHAR